MSLTYTINGFDLNDQEQGFTLLESSNFASPISPRRVDLQIPHLHGEIALWDDELQPTKLALRVRITGPDEDTFRERWEHLRSLMRVGANQPLSLRRLHGTQILSTFAQLEAMDEPDFWCAVRMADVTMVFNIPTGRWTAVLPTIEDVAFTGPSGQTQVSFVEASTAPVSEVVFRLDGTSDVGGWAQVEDLTSRTALRADVNVAMDGTEYLYLDVSRFTAWRNTASDAWTVDAADNTDSGVLLRAPLQGLLSLTSEAGLIVGQRTSAVRTRYSTVSAFSFTARGFATFL